MPKETHETATPQAEAPQPQAAPEPSPPTPFTEAEALAELQDWMRRCEAANLSALVLATRVVFRRGIGFFDTVAAGIEGSIGTSRKG